jgi:hypothetical protein
VRSRGYCGGKEAIVRRDNGSFMIGQENIMRMWRGSMKKDACCCKAVMPLIFGAWVHSKMTYNESF